MDAAQVSPREVGARRWERGRWASLALYLLAWALRLPPGLANRLHPDEALYGYWGLLIGHCQDPWLVDVPVYKPPLLPYLVAGAQALFGDSELTVRLPGLAAGLLMVPLAAALARSLYRDRAVASLTAVAAGLSPFAILFSVTAFPDPVMVVLGLAACVAAARGRPGWSGLLAGLSLATKQTGLVWVPLALVLGLMRGGRVGGQPSGVKGRTSNGKRQGRWDHRTSWVKGRVSGRGSAVRAFLVCLGLSVGLVVVWDAVRVARGAKSFWDVGVIGYGGLRLIWPQEVGTRFRGWAALARHLFVSPIANGVLGVGVPVLAWAALTRGRGTREGFTDLLLGSFCVVHLLVHWLWAFPIWDRYLLPLVPVLAVLLGRCLSRLLRYLPRVTGHLPSQNRDRSLLIVHLSLLIALAFPALRAAQSRYPVGGDHGLYDGIDQVAALLRGLPEGAVIYQHWLGWHFEYYLFHAPVYLAYWPTPAWLARDVQAFGGREPRYITFPSRESTARVERALAGVGYGLEQVLATVRRDGTRSFAVYRILPLADP